jgi:ABC-2 type transport system permease protein
VSAARATALVAGRELRESFRRRTLWIVLAILFVGSSLAMILPDVIGGGTDHLDVAVVDRGGTPSLSPFAPTLRSAARGVGEDVRVRVVHSPSRARDLVDEQRVDAAVVLSSPPVVVTRADEDAALVALVRQALTTSALQHDLRTSGLDPASVSTILDRPPARVQQIAVDSSDRTAAAAVLSLLLYLVLLMLMMQAANGVAIEKANRVSEVLLAIVRPGALLFGKIIGVGLVGLAGLAAGALPVVAKVVAGGDLPAGLGPALAGGLAWILLGFVLYLTIAGALGALVERQEEAGTVLGPLTLLLIASYVLAQSAADGPFGALLAVFPLTSPIVMPTRIALGAATSAEIALSLVVGVATVVVVVKVGAAVYRRGIVHTGRRLRLSEVMRAP